jgi:hypothetical protein
LEPGGSHWQFAVAPRLPSYAEAVDQAPMGNVFCFFFFKKEALAFYY